jgi:intein/homing endonuclease/phage terminase large subunit-like protein
MARDNIFAELAKGFISGSGEVADIITFIEAPWGLNMHLLPVQRFILKTFYSLPLDNKDAYLSVYNVTNDHILYTFTERGFLDWLYNEGRCNTNETEGKNFHELILSVGRRGSKCRYADDWCNTSLGTMTYGELLRRSNGGERLSLLTYDPVTLKRQMTSDFRVWSNGRQPCFAITTKRGIREISSWNHPYLVWRDGWDKPDFVELECLSPGDRIGVSRSTCFGKGGIGVNKAKLLGYLQGDGGTTRSVQFTNASEMIIDEIGEIIKAEFGPYEIVKVGKESHCYGYAIVKDSRRFAQTGSQPNDVKDWLVSIGCFGKKATEKEIPKEILEGSKAEVSAFLSRLFACDGWASVDSFADDSHPLGSTMVGYSSASFQLANGVRHLLQKFGIHGVLKRRPVSLNGKIYDAYKVEIRESESLRIFADEIGIFSKEESLSSVMSVVDQRGVEKGQFRSVPIGIWEHVRHIKRDRGLSGADIVGFHGRGHNDRLRMQYCPSRSKVADYGKNINDSFLEDMGNSDVLWDEVESVDFVGEQETVDVEIPSTHIIGGDIVSHNSSMAAFIANYEIYKLVRRGDPVKYYGFNPGAQFYILNVAPTDDQSAIVYDMMQAQSAECPYMRDRSIHNTMTYFDIQTDADIAMKGKKSKASIVVLSGGCSSNALRGRNAIVVIMDEMAFFLDNAGRFSGTEVYRALTPSVASFADDGKVICISSPYAKYGAFYDRFLQSFHEADSTLSFKMYSAMVNHENVSSSILKAARQRDRSSFMCEYGAEFSDAVVAWVDDENEFRRCITLPEPSVRGVTDTQYFMGIDLGFKNDGSSIAIVHRDPKTGKIILDHADVWFSGASDVWDFDDSIYSGCRKYANQDLLRMSDIVDEVLELVRWFPLKAGVFDQSNGYALAELVKANGLNQLEMENFTDKKNHEVYELTKRLYAEQIVEMYDHPVLVPEMLTLEGERRSKNIIIVRAPKRRGAHDDISDAFARAVWICYKTFKKQSPHIATGAGGSMSGMGAGIFRGPPELRVKQQTLKSFQLQQFKKHGEHPRLGSPRRWVPGVVR